MHRVAAQRRVDLIDHDLLAESEGRVTAFGLYPLMVRQAQYDNRNGQDGDDRYDKRDQRPAASALHGQQYGGPLLRDPATSGHRFATNYRHCTTRHVEMTLRMMAPLRRLTPWRDSVDCDRLARQIRLERMIGGVFAAVGVVMCLGGIVGLIGWAVR